MWGVAEERGFENRAEIIKFALIGQNLRLASKNEKFC